MAWEGEAVSRQTIRCGSEVRRDNAVTGSMIEATAKPF